jgi:transposase
MDAPVTDSSGGSPTPACPRCAELEAQVKALREQVRRLQARLDELDRQGPAGPPPLHSGNSSLPPSSDPPHLKFKFRRRKKPGSGRPGGRPGHDGHHRKRLPPERVDEVVDYRPDACRHCGSGLASEPRPGDPAPRWHQVAEVPPPAAVVTEHRAHGRRCACCGRVTFAHVPDEIRRHGCFGPRLAALVGYLAARCHDGKRTVREILADAFGVPISLGSVSAREREVARALRRPYRQAQRHVRRAAVKHVDETSWADRGRPCWLWAATTDRAALYRVHRRRTAKALRRLLGDRQRGTVVTDRFAAYARWPADQRQLCWAHLKRDFTRFWELAAEQRARARKGTGGTGGGGTGGGGTGGGDTAKAKADRAKAVGGALGRCGLAACRGVFALWRDCRAGKLTRAQLAAAVAPLRAALRRSLRWWRDFGRGRPQRFARNLLAHEQSLWTFARQEGVEPTNNPAERVLRPAVLWRKRSFGTRGPHGRRFAERALTAVQTLRLQGRDVLDFLCRAVEALRAGSPAPRLVYG